jgi:predicted AAA+ superfamily ATPase
MTSRLSSFLRTLKIVFDEEQAILLLGPRKVGKTTFLSKSFPRAIYFDLLKSDVRARFQINPAYLREIVYRPGSFVVCEA